MNEFFSHEDYRRMLEVLISRLQRSELGFVHESVLKIIEREFPSDQRHPVEDKEAFLYKYLTLVIFKLSQLGGQNDDAALHLLNAHVRSEVGRIHSIQLELNEAERELVEGDHQGRITLSGSGEIGALVDGLVALKQKIFPFDNNTAERY